MITRLLRDFAPYWRMLAASMFFNILFAAMSGLLLFLATSLISALFEGSAATSPATAVNPTSGMFDFVKITLTQLLQKWIVTGDAFIDLRNLCFALIIVTLFKNLFFYLQGFYTARVEQGITRTLRDQIYAHMQKLSLQYFHRSRTGELMSVATNDVTKIHETLNNTINNLIRDPLLIVVYLVMMLSFSWRVTLITFMVLPLISLLIYQVGRLMRRYSERAQQSLAEISGGLEETISNIRIVRAYAAEASALQRFMTSTSRYFRTMLKINRVRLLSNPINELLGVAAVIFILWWGGQQVLSNQFLPAKDFILCLFLIFSMIAPAKSVSSVHIKVNEGLAAAKRIFDLLDIQPQVIESPNPIHVTKFEKGIVFENVAFEYNVGEPVLEDISFTVKKGEIVALVGPSGSGKSTLVDLVCRFYDPSMGRITIDGNDLRDVSFVSLRGLLGVVTQETILFNDTVANNIAYPKTKIDSVRLEQAAKAANAHGFILQMPKGYDTTIGTRGLMVSGGERQRLAIARALMKDPEILIFDEATSSLDTESERLVQEAIDHLMAGRTTIVIAHRLSTILHADKILVLQDGRIVERGTHEDLLRLNGVYRRLYNLQFEGNNAHASGEKISTTGEDSQRD